MTNSDSFDLKDFLPYLLNQAADRSSRGFEQYYKSKYGMLRTEWRVVFHLGRHGELTAKEICDRAQIHKTKVSRAVRALEQKRFLKRQQMPDDRRHEALELTPAGMHAFRDLLEEACRFDAEMMSQFTDAERTVLRSCLIRIAGL